MTYITGLGSIRYHALSVGDHILVDAIRSYGRCEYCIAAISSSAVGGWEFGNAIKWVQQPQPDHVPAHQMFAQTLLKLGRNDEVRERRTPESPQQEDKQLARALRTASRRNELASPLSAAQRGCQNYFVSASGKAGCKPRSESCFGFASSTASRLWQVAQSLVIVLPSFDV